jgi:WD40 repeat protein
VELLDIQERRIIREYHRNSKEFTTCALGGVDGSVLIAGDQSSIAVWNTKNGVQKTQLRGHARKVNGIVVNPVNPLEFISYSYDHSLIVWHISNQETSRKRTHSQSNGHAGDARLEKLKDYLQELERQFNKQQESNQQQLTELAQGFESELRRQAQQNEEYLTAALDDQMNHVLQLFSKVLVCLVES